MMILDADGNPILSDCISLRDLTFKELPRRMKLSFLTISAIVAAIAVLLSNIQTIKATFTTPSPDLSLEDTVISDDGYARRVDMFILNKGDARALITRARVEVLDEIRMTDHGIGGAPMDVEVQYDVTLNLGDPENTVATVSDFAREIEPRDADRISFNITTQDANSVLLIAYKIQVVLTYNDSTELKSPVLLVPGYMGPRAFNFYGDIPPKVKAQFPTLYERLNGTETQKGLAITNMIVKLKKHMDEGK